MEGTNPKPKWHDILIFIVNLCAFLFFACGAVLVFLTVLISLLYPSPGMSRNPITSILLAFALITCAGLSFPGFYFSLCRIQQKPVPDIRIPRPRFWQICLVSLFWVGNLLVADFLNGKFSLGWLAAVPFFMLAIILPVAVLAWIAIGGLTPGSARRTWSSLSVGMSVSPLLAAFLEFLMGFILLVIAVVFLMLHPEWTSAALRLSSRLSHATDLETMLTILTPVLTSPAVIVCMFLVMCLFIPLIEEAVKPLFVWAAGRKEHSPAEGFVMGVLCGAGFALVEGLVAASSPSDGWGALMAARAGGSLMHIATTGMMGWAIVSARRGQPMKLAITYLCCVFLHGLWNAAAVLGILAALGGNLEAGGTVSLASLPTAAAGGIILVIVPVTLSVLIRINRHLQTAKASPSDIIAPPSN